MASRKPEDLDPRLQPLYRAFDTAMDAAGIDYILTCTRRTQAEQSALYEQGRSKPGPIVTWTRKSKHVEGKAFDIVVMENGKPDWNVTNPNWTRAGEIGRKIGLIWGGSWARSKDFPHFELPEGVKNA